MATRPKTRPAVGSAWFWYLAAATVGQAVFALFYGLVLARLTAFGWNRAYLLSALALSVGLPLLALPAAWAQLLWPAAPTAALALPLWQLAAAPLLTTAAAPAPGGVSWQALVLSTYWLGVAYQVSRTVRSLGWLHRLSRRHPRTRLGRGWLVQLPAPSRPAFSFGRYVFLSPAHAQLSPAEYGQLVQHEQVHGAQHHSLDLLLAEGVGWFFWFNGLVPYLARQLRTVHEYLADAAVTRPAGSRVAYGRLLLKLATGPLPSSLVHPFSARQVALRILMLTNPPSSPMQKIRFLLVVPVAALAWVGAAALGPTPSVAANAPGPAAPTPPLRAQSRIGTITWQGNKFLSAAQLTEALGLKPGDAYSKEVLDTHLSYRPDNSDVDSRHMDQGYLFFQVDPVIKTQPDGTTNLTFRLNEGPQFHLGTVLVKGNKRVPTADILALVPLHTGDLFSRAKLVETAKILGQSGTFDPAKLSITPQPLPRADHAPGIVNIELVVAEK